MIGSQHFSSSPTATTPTPAKRDPVDALCAPLTMANPVTGAARHAKSLPTLGSSEAMWALIDEYAPAVRTRIPY